MIFWTSLSSFPILRARFFGCVCVPSVPSSSCCSSSRDDDSVVSVFRFICVVSITSPACCGSSPESSVVTFFDTNDSVPRSISSTVIFDCSVFGTFFSSRTYFSLRSKSSTIEVASSQIGSVFASVALALISISSLR